MSNFYLLVLLLSLVFGAAMYWVGFWLGDRLGSWRDSR